MIYIHKGDDTSFNGSSFLKFELETEWDLTGWKAIFVLHNVTKEITDISSKVFDVNLSAKETEVLPFGKLGNELKLVDNDGKTKTIGKDIEIIVTSEVVENKTQTINLPILKDDGLDINVKISSIPTKLSQLENDCDFLSAVITDPVENQIIKFDGEKWVNARQTGGGTGGSGTFDHSELDNRNLANQHKISAITDLQETLDSKANKNEIPTLEGYATESYVAQEIGKIPSADLSEYVTNAELENKGYLTQHQDISNLAAKNDIPTKTSQLTNDSSFATESYVTNKIAEVQLGGGEVDLSGLVTKDELNAKADKTELHSHSNKTVLDGITAQNINDWNNKSDFDGNYNSLTNKPTIPTKVSELTNDKNYLIEHQDISNLATKDELENKQDVLTSGVNIKTINNQSILGKGNITIVGGEGSSTGGGGSAFNLFDTKITDYILEGEQSIGWALQGSYVTKADYPDFYNKCLEEYKNESNTIEYLDSVAWEQPANPTGLTATEGWFGVDKLFDDSTVNFASCGTTTDYIEWDLGQTIYLTGFSVLGEYVSNSPSVNVAVYSVDGDGVETLIKKGSGAKNVDPYTSSASFAGVYVNKLRFYLIKNDSGGTPSTDKKARITTITLTASLSIELSKNPNGHTFSLISYQPYFDDRHVYGIDEVIETVLLPTSSNIQDYEYKYYRVM